MHKKDIKAQIRKQLKTEFPKWHRLTRNEKKGIAKKVLNEVVDSYDYPKEIETPIPELLGLSGQQPTKGILTIEQMAKIVEAHQEEALFKPYEKPSTHPAIRDVVAFFHVICFGLRS